MDAATLILTMTFAGQTFDKVMTRPTLVECEEYARDVVQSAPNFPTPPARPPRALMPRAHEIVG